MPLRYCRGHCYSESGSVSALKYTQFWCLHNSIPFTWLILSPFLRTPPLSRDYNSLSLQFITYPTHIPPPPPPPSPLVTCSSSANAAAPYLPQQCSHFNGPIHHNLDFGNSELVFPTANPNVSQCICSGKQGRRQPTDSRVSERGFIPEWE